MKNVTVRFETSEIVVTKSFMKKASTPFTPEFEQLASLMERLPKFHIVQAHTPNHRNRTFQPSYSQMESYIMCQDNSDALMDEYNNICAEATMYHNPYQFVRKWFVNRFSSPANPQYDEEVGLAA